MKAQNPGVVIIGCGNIARQYATQLFGAKSDERVVTLCGWYDLDSGRAKKFAEQWGGKVYADMREIGRDTEAGLIVNLTVPEAHETIIRQALEMEKHVYTEKPFTLTPEKAGELGKMAASKGLVLQSAPITYLGDAQKLCLDYLKTERIGKVRLVYAELNQGRIETWHPAPESFYNVGVMWDVGIYSLTYLVACFGPVATVEARGEILLPQRQKLNGEIFTITKSDYINVHLHFESGIICRFTANFYASGGEQGTSIEFHGDDGHLYLESPYMFNARVAMGKYGKAAETISQENPYDGIEFARGVRETVKIIQGRQAEILPIEVSVHVIAVLSAIDLSLQESRQVELQA